jgi:glycosyltransferase involved in cell wall biosynthesis
MKKILIFLPSLSGGGAERVIVNICRNIDKTKFTVYLTLSRKTGQYLDLLPPDIQIIDLHKPRLQDALFDIIKVIREIKPDAMLSTLTHHNIYLCMLKILFPKIKIIIRECNIPSIKLSPGVIKRSRLLKWLYTVFIHKADLIICQSNDMKDDLLVNFNVKESKITVINNPVNADYIQQQSLEVPDFVLPQDKKSLISAGRLCYQKGYDLLLKTFSQLPNRDDYVLVILGDGNLKPELLAQTESLGIERQVFIVGFVKNPYKYFARADFFISSSRFEGFPNAVIEALACGTPVIANIYPGGINEIINENNGSIIDITNVSSFNDALLKQYNSQDIRKDCKDKYAIEKIIKNYEKIFES